MKKIINKVDRAFIILSICSLLTGKSAWAEMSDTELRFRALEEKIEVMKPKEAKNGVSFETHGVKKQGQKPPTYNKKGFHFESADGLFSTNLQWRAQMRFANPDDSDPRVASKFTDPENDRNNFEMRRLRMKIGGHGYKKWIKYYFEVDLQPSRDSDDSSTASSSRIIDWRITVQPWEQFGFRVGQWKINYNRERVDSSGRQQFVERSIVNRVFNIDRQVGLLFKGRLFKGTNAESRYYAGVFNGEGRSVQNTDTNMMWMGRWQWNFLGRDLKWRQSDVKRHKKPTGQLAFAYAYNKGECTRWSSSGCGSLDGFSLGNEDQFVTKSWVQEFAYKHNGLSIQQEYHEKEIEDRDNGVTYDLEGMYAQAGYFLHEVAPSVPEQLEMAFRYAYVDHPNKANVLVLNEREEYTICLNYFIAGHNNKITLDYSYLTLDDNNTNADYSDNRVRLQWDISF